MAQDSPSTWNYLDGNGIAKSGNNTVDLSGNTTNQMALRTNGGPVEKGNELPTAQRAASYSNAITIASAVSTTSEPLITAGGPATGRLEIFNNTTGNDAGTLWINPSGGTAIAGQGIPVIPGGSYTWQNGLAAIPQGISDNGALSISGAGGY